jgi:hypothetical protein
MFGSDSLSVPSKKSRRQVTVHVLTGKPSRTVVTTPVTVSGGSSSQTGMGLFPSGSEGGPVIWSFTPGM